MVLVNEIMCSGSTTGELGVVATEVVVLLDVVDIKASVSILIVDGSLVVDVFSCFCSLVTDCCS